MVLRCHTQALKSSFYFRKKKVLINHTEVKHFVHLCSIYIQTFMMENEKFLALQSVPIKSSHFNTGIALKILGQKLSFDGFAMERSIFIQLYDSH